MQQSKRGVWLGAALTVLLLSPVGAQTVVVPVEPPVIEAPTTATTTVITPPAGVAVSGMPVQVPTGTVIIPTSSVPNSGWVIPQGGGKVHYWTDGSGVTRYQYYDATGRRQKIHQL